MNSLKQEYAQLLQLTQLYLLREYEMRQMQVIDPNHAAFFQKKLKSLPSIKKTVRQPPPPLPKQSTKIIENMVSAPSEQKQRPTEPRPEPIPPKPTPPPTKPEPAPQEPLPPTIQKALSPSENKQPLLEPFNLNSTHSTDERELRKRFVDLFPEIALTHTCPNDNQALMKKNAWMREQQIPPVIILAFQNDDQELTFLKNIAHAISLYFFPARLLFPLKMETDKSWEHIFKLPHLRLIIACDTDLFLRNELMQFYKKKEKHFLDRVPLLLLSKLSLYLKEPQLKSALWHTICHELKPQSLTLA